MSFSYDGYVDGEGSVVFFFLLAFVPFLVYLLKLAFSEKRREALKRSFHEKFRGEPILRILYYGSAIFFEVIMLVSVLCVLIPSGLAVIRDADCETQEKVGVVTEIEPRFFLWSPAYKGKENLRCGNYVYLSNERFYMPCDVDISVGDELRITYWPESHYVASCEMLNAVAPRQEPVVGHDFSGWILILGIIVALRFITRDNIIALKRYNREMEGFYGPHPWDTDPLEDLFKRNRH